MTFTSQCRASRAITVLTLRQKAQVLRRNDRE
jgi:hypothetical protein